MAIKWQDVVITVFTTVGGGAVILAAVAWLIRTVITDRLARDAEAFKTRLKADADVEIERLKNSLQMTALEHEVRFSKLHERRAEVIAEVYKRLVQLHAEGSLFVSQVGITGMSNENPEQVKWVLAVFQNNQDFIRLIEDNRIYLPARVCDLLAKYAHALSQATSTSLAGANPGPPTPFTAQQKTELLRDAYSAIDGDIPEMKRALEIEFRAILGDTSLI